MRGLSWTLVVAAVVGTAADRAAAEAPAAKPWEQHYDCDWWLAGEDGRSHRASIGQSDEGLILSLSDPAFASWPEESRPAVEFRFGENGRRSWKTRGWATHGSEGVGMFGVWLDAKGRRTLSGASRLELRRDGRSIVVLPLAGTPSEAALEACTPPPISESRDTE